MRALDYPFDSTEIIRRKKSLKRQLGGQSDLLEKRLAILSGSTVGDIKDVLELFLLNSGIAPQFFIGQYNRFYEDVMFENRELAAFRPELLYIHTTTRNLSDGMIGDKLQSVWAKIRDDFSCPVIQNNFELPASGLMLNPISDPLRVNRLNIQIAGYALQNRDFYVNDIQHLSACFGLNQWFDEQDYFLYKYAFSVSAIPLFCHNAAKIIKSVYGKNQKCLVLDLDNTLWGGAAGDLGPAGIELGPETAVGEACLSFQKYVKTLRERGVILAVCSKNDERTAREAFANPNMVLKLEDFAVFCANWNSKAENLLKIAEQLNILPESMVFVDDSPAERELIRQALPDVKVPEARSAAEFIRNIEGAGYFYTANVSADDVRRNEYYASDVRRSQAKSTFVDYGEYLRSLQMSAAIGSFHSANWERVTQLINKTNQFNLTTRRYSLSEIEKITADSNFVTLYATLDDRFGGNGIVSALIGERVQKALHVRLWVMSCRVFKRDLELAVFDTLVEICKRGALKKIVGYYFKTEKNGYAANLLDDLGFSKAASKAGDEIWEFDLAPDYFPQNRYIKIESNPESKLESKFERNAGS